MSAIQYGLHASVDLSYEDAIARVTELLKSEGFGILTEIDVKATLKTKLDVDVDQYVILGACNPKLAHRAIQADPSVGLLLPCNVTVYADAASGKTKISIFDPGVMTTLNDNQTVCDVAAEAREKLERVVAAL